MAVYKQRFLQEDHMFEKQKAWAGKHIILTSAQHVAAGFGLALVLQHYIAGNAFLPVIVGWLLLAFSGAIHAISFIRAK